MYPLGGARASHLCFYAVLGQSLTQNAFLFRHLSHTSGSHDELCRHHGDLHEIRPQTADK